MDKPKSKFPTMDNSAATTAKNASGAPLKGKLVKKKGAQAGDPAAQAAPARGKIKAVAKRAFGIRTSMPAWKDPQIGPVQGNGKLFSSVMNRTKPNFDAGTSDFN